MDGKHDMFNGQEIFVEKSSIKDLKSQKSITINCFKKGLKIFYFCKVSLILFITVFCIKLFFNCFLLLLFSGFIEM